MSNIKKIEEAVNKVLKGVPVKEAIEAIEAKDEIELPYARPESSYFERGENIGMWRDWAQEHSNTPEEAQARIKWAVETALSDGIEFGGGFPGVEELYVETGDERLYELTDFFTGGFLSMFTYGEEQLEVYLKYVRNIKETLGVSDSNSLQAKLNDYGMEDSFEPAMQTIKGYIANKKPKYKELAAALNLYEEDSFEPSDDEIDSVDLD